MTRRTLRVNELLRDELSLLLQRKIKDPRLNHLVTITDVSVSKDFKNAEVFVSTMGSEEEKEEVFRGLNSAANFLRRSLADRISLRHIPRLTFNRDDSLERGALLLKLMNQVSPTHQDDSPPAKP
ncbi:MAG: 30S ribosome-binding factor RbfA [Dehalococcoidia bacterium]